VNQALRALSERLERLARPTDDGRFSWRRLAWLLARTPKRPKLETARLAALVDQIDRGRNAHLWPRRTMLGLGVDTRVSSRQADWAEPTGDAFTGALRELGQNLARAERVSFVYGRLPDGHLDQLWRLYQVLYRAAEWATAPDAHRRALIGDLISADARCALEPLTTSRAHSVPRPVYGVDPLIAAANAETRSLGRQRRLLEAARQQLLDVSAAVPVEPAADRARRVLIARRLARLDRLEAAGVSPDVDLGFQLREAAARGETQRLFAGLSALEQSAFAAGDLALHRLAGRAADLLWGPGADDRTVSAARTSSLRQSQEQLFGPRLQSAIDDAYQAGLRNLKALRATPPEERKEDGFFYSKEFFDDWERYFTVGATQGMLSAAVAADGCFQVGGTSSPVRGAREAQRLEVVSFPQQEMVLETMGDVSELANAVIGDPRSLLMDLAAGKLLARRYLCPRPGPAGERRMRNEVRVYVLDGSSSMLGPRARMRDALLLAELSTLTARLADPERPGNPVLYYRYFNDEVGATRRIATADEAEAAVTDVLSQLRYGGTDIEGALLASFEQIRLARADDPDLARAQIVLVTDGEADVSDEKLRAAREKVGDLPVGVSIIALGAENPNLRRLAARQRTRGERVFYQFLDDDELGEIVEGETAGLPVHLPAGASADRLSDELRGVVADIERHLRRLDADQLAHAQEIPGALSEVGLPVQAALDRGARARLAALEHDRVTLDDAFLRGFPAAAAPGGRPPEGAPPPAVIANILAALATVAEVVETFGTAPTERQADAIELIERLLAEASVPPWAYAAAVRQPSDALKKALRAVHLAARFGASAQGS
jgi:hypothetical protein